MILRVSLRTAAKALRCLVGARGAIMGTSLSHADKIALRDAVDGWLKQLEAYDDIATDAMTYLRTRRPRRIMETVEMCESAEAEE